MEIIASYATNAGNVKDVNQDSLSIRVVNSPRGKIAFAVVCDGMGGLEQGELASKEVVVAFNNWFATEFAKLVVANQVSQEPVFMQWEAVIDGMNDRIKEYAAQQGMMMGTTVSALLVYRDEYYVCHVGDSQIFQIDRNFKKITEDHTLVAQEVRSGRLRSEDARRDPRRNILLQCVGASEEIEPQMEYGRIEEDTTFLLSTDGFIHLVSHKELFEAFRPEKLREKNKITSTCNKMIETIMERGERDNITAIAIVVKGD